ncbi:MAG: helicase C-terminal domain-containing protein [Chloroflexota bacterium]
MRGDLVALDLETTGLDVEKDSIIEIGAVRMREGAVVAQYSTLVNPGFMIPAETTHITGIHQEDVRGQPELKDVLEDVIAFVGDAPVIAHNVSFDISFMRRFGALKQNLPIDTFEIATIMMPRAAGYSLSSLTSILDINLQNAHRALDDARATALLYWHMYEKMLALPSPILYEIVQGMQTFGWETGTVFRAAYDEVQSADDDTRIAQVQDIFEPLDRVYTPLERETNLAPIGLSEVKGILKNDGQLDSVLDSYEHRDEQLAMAEQVANTFNSQNTLLMEAGTGIGKSLAYLVPAVLWAVQNKTRVVISTNTINLQEQLIDNDVQLLKQSLDVDFDAVVMKGRGNYLCPRRLAGMRRRQPKNLDELKTLAKILVWLQESQTGDKGELSLRSGEYFVWDRLSAADEDCALNRCAAQMEGLCPYYKARKKAEAAHIVITNHALLVSDALHGNSVLPAYNYLIADEAHHLEDAITSGLTTRIQQRDLVRRITDIGDASSGLLGDMLRAVRQNAPEKHAMRLESFIGDISDVASATQVHAVKFFESIFEYIEDSRSQNTYKIRLDDKRRGHTAWQGVSASWDTLYEYMDVLVDALKQLAGAMTKLKKYNIPYFDDHYHAIGAAGANLETIYTELQALVKAPDSNYVYWINNARSADWLSLQSAPVNVGNLMEKFIWNAKDAVVLTSATLRTGDDFSFIRERLYAETADERALGSPYDYGKSAMLFVPDDMPMPNQNGYQYAVEKGIINLATALDGRVMVLFTSYGQLRETAANISQRLAGRGIQVYDQATGGSREALLDSFKSTEKAVLLGTRSFWEGIDIPGDDLVALVITRLPFAVPNDPVFAARSSRYNDAFQEYAVPEAILRFRQGFGRLIRSSTDRGIVAVFDSRVVHKSYGMRFVEALPDVTLEYGKLEDVGNRAKAWLEKTDSDEE